jgi:hypothetical protein
METLFYIESQFTTVFSGVKLLSMNTKEEGEFFMCGCDYENGSRNNVCRRFASILGAQVLQSENGLCVVTFNRNLDVEILGRTTRSPLVLAALFSFEGPADNQGRTLNLGETVLLQREVNRFITVLRRNGIIVTALHNHWLFENPRLMYVHFESIDQPLDFARKVAEAFDQLRRE